MNLVEISIYGEGYYSARSYSETVFLLEEDYNSLEKGFDEMEISLGELDGKHSGVAGEITVSTLVEDEQPKYNFNISNDGERLRNALNNYTDNLDEMIERANKYILNIDSIFEMYHLM